MYTEGFTDNVMTEAVICLNPGLLSQMFKKHVLFHSVTCVKTPYFQGPKRAIVTVIYLC